MDEVPSLLAAVTQAIARGATVITANQRAARTLRHRIDRQHQASGLAYWQPAPILTWEAWLETLWRRVVLTGADTRPLLTATQQHRLWCSILESDTDRAWSSLQTTDALARLASEAWDRLSAYNGLAQLRSLDVSTDSRTFQRWAVRFANLCRTEGYLPPSGLAAELAAMLTTRLSDAVRQQILATHELYLIGFDSTTPAQESLLSALQRSGVHVDRHHAAIPSARLQHTAADPAAEITAAATWLREQLTASPAPTRIAVIVPALETDRSEIERIFRRTLAPELIPIDASDRPDSTLPYGFSLGAPLAQAPMIVVALDLLRWPTQPLPPESVTRLLLAPSFCPAFEFDARAEFDAFILRGTKTLRPELPLESVLTALTSSRARAPRRTPTTALLRQLQALHHTAQRLQLQRELKRSYAEWAAAIRELLEAAEWSPRPSLDSNEFQLLQRWERSLDELATLDFDGHRPSWTEALAALESILTQTLFAPQSRNAPIQIVGPLEAAGSEFDAIWFLRASEADWPIRPAAAPLLGWQIQHKLAMPGTDAALDHAYARRITQRIVASAPRVVFSHASHSSEGPQRPSPLLAELTLEPLSLASTAPEHPSEPIPLEAVEDSPPIPFEGSHIRGGTSVLQAQAACPFRAFAERRLWSTELEQRNLGLDAAQRGTLVHTTLERLWRDLRDQATLRTLTTDQQSEALHRAITAALQEAKLPPPETEWERAYLALQQERLHHLLRPWLELELSRKLPFTVKLQEEKIERTIGPLTLDLRSDRVDETEAGDVLIDYKTGEATPADWFGDRPNEPQVPLYAVLAHPGPLAAVAFGRVRPGDEMHLHGIQATSGILSKEAKLPPLIETLDHLVAHWQQVLTQLAEDFAAGDARVDPRERDTCKYCAQDLLCRIDPSFFDRASLTQITLDEEPAE